MGYNFLPGFVTLHKTTPRIFAARCRNGVLSLHQIAEGIALQRDMPEASGKCCRGRCVREGWFLIDILSPGPNRLTSASKIQYYS